MVELEVKNRYEGKIILAPMVRVGVLPTRLLALDYGADLVYSEEIIDYKLMNCKRVENKLLDTVDFVSVNGDVIFQTCNIERSKVVLQMGTACATRALKAAQIVENDVSAIDINMGCPKNFSISGGMGAALLKKPEKVKEILTTLVTKLKIPVTCKIRVLPTIDETVQLARLIQTTGVAALAVHGRTKPERPSHPNRNEFIRAVAEAVDIPIIANGGSSDVHTYKDIEVFRRTTGASSVMLARAAQKNISIFDSNGRHSGLEVAKNFVKYAIQYDLSYQLCKYCVLTTTDVTDTPLAEQTTHSFTLKDIAKVWGLEDFYADTMMKRRLKQKCWDEIEKSQQNHTEKTDDIIRLHVKYNSRDYMGCLSPKSILYEYSNKHLKVLPKYNTTHEGSRFNSVVCYDGHLYSSNSWSKSKREAEQSSAMVCLITLDIGDLVADSDANSIQTHKHTDTKSQ